MGSYDQNIEKLDFLIIGGGVAGLAAANRLVDRGISPTMVDAGSYPSHKICGEFFSYECHPILKEWEALPSALIDTIKFHVGNKSFPFPLPMAARGVSRFSFDNSLCKRAVSRGATALTHAKVVEIAYNPDAKYEYTVSLHSGKTLQAKTLFIGTGRILNLLSGKPPPKMRYLGMKAHFEGIGIEKSLEMFIIPHGYLGMSRVENDQTNVACIADIKAVRNAGSPDEYLKGIIELPEGRGLRKAFGQGKMIFNDWMVTEVPEFKSTSSPYHSYSNLFLIGDAAASIAPASGDGLAMAVTSGVMAADFAVKGEDKSYQHHWAKLFRKRLRWAKVLHKIMLHPLLSQVTLRTCSHYPEIFNFLYHRTRN